MIRKFLLNLLASTALALGLASGASADPALFIYSTIDALLAGTYDGEITVRELGTKGNFGLGTYNGLDGEMVLLNGTFYHVKADGTVGIASPGTKVPLAYVLPFTGSGGFTMDEASPPRALAAIEATIDAHLVNMNHFFGVQVAGRFSGVKTRAIARQARPYKPLAEVSKTQAVFERDTVDGTLVGIRSPAFSRGVSVPGWHWHFISDDRAFGGHVLAATLIAGSIAVAHVSNLTIKLPDNQDFAAADQAKDRSKELHEVETEKR